jgi:hypothetical protein
MRGLQALSFFVSAASKAAAPREAFVGGDERARRSIPAGRLYVHEQQAYVHIQAFIPTRVAIEALDTDFIADIGETQQNETPNEI